MRYAWTVNNDRELKQAYEYIRWSKELIKHHGYSLLDSPDEFNSYIKGIKVAIREYNKRASDRRVVKDNGIDGFVELIALPDYLKDMDEATEYFENNEVLMCRPSLYDCTGQAFTSWYKIIKRRGRLMAYHSVGIDV